MEKSKLGWGLKWRSENRVDGRNEYLMWKGIEPLVFNTRSDARAYRDEHYGYIKRRPDLQAEPYGWKMPQVVRVRMSIEAL